GTENETTTLRRALCSRRVASGHRDFDFASVTESCAWNFRSTELEDGVTRKRGTIFPRRRGVGEIAGRTCGRQTGAVIPTDRVPLINHEDHEGRLSGIFNTS